MRPKSNATVVVCLSTTRLPSSTPTLASVMISSVLSGAISLTAPTMVVLPTPNPPTTTILSPWLAVRCNGRERPGPGASSGARSEILEPNEHLLEHVGVGQLGPGRGGDRRPPDRDAALVEQVAQQHLDHADRQPEHGRDLDHRHRVPALAQDLHVLGLHAR